MGCVTVCAPSRASGSVTRSLQFSRRHDLPVHDAERIDAGGYRRRIDLRHCIVLVDAFDKIREPLKRQEFLATRRTRHGFHAMAEIEIERRHRARQCLGGLPPHGPAAFDEAGRNEERVGNAVLAEHGCCKLRIVAAAVVEREAHEFPPVGRIRQQLRQLLEMNRMQSALKGGAIAASRNSGVTDR